MLNTALVALVPLATRPRLSGRTAEPDRLLGRPVVVKAGWPLPGRGCHGRDACGVLLLVEGVAKLFEWLPPYRPGPVEAAIGL